MANQKISALTALTGANVDFAADVLAIVDTSAAATKKILAGELLPPGMVVPYAGTTAPGGWILCFGQTVSQATFPALYLILGTTYGSDAGGNFTLPDLRGRAVFGDDNMGGSTASRVTAASGITGTTLGATGGNELTQAHTHGVEGLLNGSAFGASVFAGNGAGVQSASYGGGSSQNMPPTIILNYIIKT